MAWQPGAGFAWLLKLIFPNLKVHKPGGGGLKASFEDDNGNVVLPPDGSVPDKLFDIRLAQGTQIVGAQGAVLKHRTSSGHNDLTQSTFDVTTRAGAANILLTNFSGTSRNVTACWIKGKPVLRRLHPKHDLFLDLEDISRNGEKLFRIGNDYIVTQDQINKIADYWRKYFRGKKHRYAVAMAGLWWDIQVGEWYRLVVGSSGTAEDIDVTVECFSVETEVMWGRLAMTYVTFRELVQNWTADASAVARYIASGKPIRALRAGSVLTVAADESDTLCTYMAPGTDDDVTIQVAIDRLSSSGGGVVELTEGAFSTGAPIVMKANVTLRMNAGTIITPDGNFDVFQVNGSAGSEIVDASIEGGVVEAANVTSAAVIDADFADRLRVVGLTVNGGYIGLDFNECDNMQILNCVLTAQTYYGMLLDDCSGICNENTVQGDGSTVTAIERAIEGWGHDLQFIGNQILNILSNHTNEAVSVQGMVIGDDSSRNILVADNIVSHMRMYHVASSPVARARAYSVDGVDVQANNNRAFDVRDAGDAGRSASTTIGASMGITGVSGVYEHIVATGNVIKDCDGGFRVGFNCDELRLLGNIAADCGNLFKGNGCEGATAAAGPRLDITGTPASPTNATWARSTDRVFSGTYSRRLRITTGGTNAVAYLVDADLAGSTADLHDMSADVTYIVKAQVSVEDPLASEVRLVVGYYNGSWNYTTLQPLATGSWEELSAEFNIPVGATGFIAYVQIDAAASSGEDVYFDEFEMSIANVDNSKATQYVNGSGNTISANNSWD